MMSPSFPVNVVKIGLVILRNAANKQTNIQPNKIKTQPLWRRENHLRERDLCRIRSFQWRDRCSLQTCNAGEADRGVQKCPALNYIPVSIISLFCSFLSQIKVDQFHFCDNIDKLDQLQTFSLLNSDTIFRKTKQIKTLPPPLKSVAALPCEMSMVNYAALQHSYFSSKW